MPEQVSEETRLDPIALFSEEIRIPVAGLMHLGYLTETVNFCGHTFVLETLRPYVKYAIAQALEPYRNTLQEPEVYAALHVGMALSSIDGVSDFCPPTGGNLREFVDARLRWITTETGWFQPTINFLYANYLNLENKAQAALMELQNLSEGNRDISPPSPGFSVERGRSADETTGDTPPSDPSSLS